jgi:tRNA dimethylallyltransferase
MAVYFIMGCTACGKGAVGRELARRLGGHILSVDSMKVYRRMDIGTAKPPPEVRASIPHYGIDVVEPWAPFSVGRYAAVAEEALATISAAGAPALAVGGTSLYIKALTEGLFDGPTADAEFRQALRLRGEREGWPALHAELARIDPPAGRKIHPNDEKRITRAMEVHHLTGEPISRLQSQWDAGRKRRDCAFIGLRRPKEDLHRRINLRVKRMVERGLREEVERLLAEARGIAPQAAQAVGYAEMIEHLAGRLDLESAIERIKINTRQLARRQRTWHRRFAGTTWFDLEADEPESRTAERILSAGVFERKP